MNSASDNKNLLSVDDLVVEYKTDYGTIHAVNGVSFQVRDRETLGLVGETGAGKTTIAKSILQILPDRSGKIKSGAISFCGESLLDATNERIRAIRGNEISMIFQDPMSALNPAETIGNQISEAIEIHEKITKKDSRTKACAMLESVGIPAERYDDYPHQFSGGMKQRVIIAMALACQPKLLLADEPTTALDVTIQAQVLELMSHLKEQFGTAIILITHNLGIVAEYCDTVATVYAGEIIEYGSVVEVFDNPAHPYTVGLFGSLPGANAGSTRLKPIPGMMPDPSNLPDGCSFSPRCPYATEKCRMSRPENRLISETHSVKCFRVME